MKSLLLLLALAVSASFANAQTSFGLGSSFDSASSPHAAISLGLLQPIAENTYLYFTGDVRNLTPGKVPQYIAQTGIAQKVFEQGWLKVFADGRIGALETTDALTGALTFGGFVPVPIHIPLIAPKNQKVQLVLGVHGQKAAATGGLQGKLQAWLMITP